MDTPGGQAMQAQYLITYLGQEPSVRVDFVPISPRLPGRLRRLQQVRFVRTVVTSLAYWALLLARVRRCDVVHVFSASYFSFLLAPTPALLVARLYGKGVVLNYHSGEAEDHLARWKRTAIPLIRRADAVAVPSGYLADVFARFGLQAQAIFNVVEGERFRFRERQPLRPVFLCNRHLEPLYNVGCVLRAFAQVQQQFPDAALLLAGDGSQRRQLETLAGEMGLRNVQFLGRVSPERMVELYDSADVFLNGSDIDNMPCSIMEAFAAGLPVVTTDAGGIPYIVTDGETGVLAPRGDPTALAEGAMRLLRDPKLASGIIRRAREECGRYAWPAVGRQWLELYRSVHGRRAVVYRGGQRGIGRENG